MSINNTQIGLYAKAVGAALAAAGTAAITALGDGHIDNLEWVTIGGAFLAALGAVWAVPEFPVSISKYMKAITAGLISGLASLSAALVSGNPFTQQDWINIAIAVVVGTGLVHVTKNATESETLMTVPVAAGNAGGMSNNYPLPANPESLPVDDDVVEDEDDSLQPVVAEEDDFVAPVETK